MKPLILIFSSTSDVHADRIQEYLEIDARVIRLNLDDPSSWHMEFFKNEILLRSENLDLSLDEVTSVLVRRLPSIDSFLASVPDNMHEYRDFIGKQKFALFSDCLAVLNRQTLFVNPLESSANLNKGIQQYLAHRSGLSIPMTYMGSNPTRAKVFCDTLFQLGEEVCTKPIQNLKLTIGGELKTRFTEKMRRSDLQDIDSLTVCPLIFQSYEKKVNFIFI